MTWLFWARRASLEIRGSKALPVGAVIPVKWAPAPRQVSGATLVVRVAPVRRVETDLSEVRERTASHLYQPRSALAAAALPGARGNLSSSLAPGQEVRVVLVAPEEWVEKVELAARARPVDVRARTEAMAGVVGPGEMGGPAGPGGKRPHGAL